MQGGGGVNGSGLVKAWRGVVVVVRSGVGYRHKGIGQVVQQPFLFAGTGQSCTAENQQQRQPGRRKLILRTKTNID